MDLDSLESHETENASEYNISYKKVLNFGRSGKKFEN